jgi:hypothetical protein
MENSTKSNKSKNSTLSPEVKAEESKVVATSEPVKAPEAAPKEAIETDVRTKLSNRTEGENPFIPAPPAKIEAEVQKIAKESGFELNRGTSIGARLMARAKRES